jgi:hypothetical protein
MKREPANALRVFTVRFQLRRIRARFVLSVLEFHAADLFEKSRLRPRKAVPTIHSYRSIAAGSFCRAVWRCGLLVLGRQAHGRNYLTKLRQRSLIRVHNGAQLRDVVVTFCGVRKPRVLVRHSTFIMTSVGSTPRGTGRALHWSGDSFRNGCFQSGLLT